MKCFVALRARGRLVGLVGRLLKRVAEETSRCPIGDRGQVGPGRKVDQRNYLTFGEIMWRLTWRPTLRLKDLAVGIKGRARSVRGTAARLGYFLSESPFPIQAVCRVWVREALAKLPPEALWTYQGMPVLVIDPTVYAKRSRRGKRGRAMEYVHRLRDPRTERTKWGYEDIWAGLVLHDGEILPVARRLFSPAYPGPEGWSENQVEDAVLYESLQCLRKAGGYWVLVVADRGLSHKERLVQMHQEGIPFVMRIRGDIQVETSRKKVGPLERLIWQGLLLGRGTWKEDKERAVPGKLYLLRGKVSFSRSGRKGDRQEAWLNFVAFLPDDPEEDPLLLVTNLGVTDLTHARGILKVYERRWGIETTLETLKAWGLEGFMVRRWHAIERACTLIALAYILLLLALYLGRWKALAPLLGQAKKLLKQLSVLGKRLTVGKLQEAIALDYERHRRAWRALLRQ